MIELMVAVLLITVGILSFAGTIDASRKLTDQSEVKEAAVHRAEREVERIQALGFKQVAHPSSTSFALSGDPLAARVVSGTEPRFKWDRKDDSKSEPLVTATTGAVDLGPTSWSDGRFSGTVYRFVTWADDAACAGLVLSPLCPNSRNYKRVTVVVTITGLRNPLKPVWFSALISDPDDGPVDAVTAPVTECLNSAGTPSACVNKLADTVRSLFLTDTPASSDVRQAISGNHGTHGTLAPTGVCPNPLLPILCTPNLLCSTLGVGCPMPDLLGTDPPPLVDGLVPSLFKYSTDVSATYTGGRVLRRDTTCSGTPTASDNTKGGFWVDPAETTAHAVTGTAGMTLYTHTVGNVNAAVTLCIAVYKVPGSLLNLISLPPTEIGRASYSLSSWPTQPTRVSFPFQYRTSSYTIPAGSRLGVRIWPASSSGADIAVIYDHPTYPTFVQFNEAGS
ncbi:MAG: hypothetical protein ABR549_07335 [Mycobacteriales bacterium]